MLDTSSRIVGSGFTSTTVCVASLGLQPLDAMLAASTLKIASNRQSFFIATPSTQGSTTSGDPFVSNGRVLGGVDNSTAVVTPPAATTATAVQNHKRVKTL